VATSPIPPPRPRTPIAIPQRRPNPNARPPSGEYEDGGGNQNRQTYPAAVVPPQQPAAQPSRFGWGAPLATSPDINDPAFAASQAAAGNAADAEANSPEARLARMTEIAAALRASIPITPGPSPPSEGPPDRLGALRARVDTTFRMPTGIPYEQMRQSSIRTWERWGETGAGTPEPPVMDPPGTPGLPSSLWMDQWEQRRTQESTNGLLAELGLAP
jgi:hypothetical protein